MIKVENIEVFNFEGAFRGLRNPMNSWHLSDSYWDFPEYPDRYVIGEKDMNLAQRMIAAGTDESKFLRQIFISMDITAPLYMLKELDTYKVGTVANSCSTMHKIHAKEFTLDDFSCEHLISDESIPTRVYSPKQMMEATIENLNKLRELYLETKDKKYWWQLIQLLPSSYNQKRTITLNYQVARAMYFARRHHKLDEWREFTEILKGLPYGEELVTYEKESK